MRLEQGGYGASHVNTWSGGPRAAPFRLVPARPKNIPPFTHKYLSLHFVLRIFPTRNYVASRPMLLCVCRAACVSAPLVNIDTSRKYRHLRCVLPCRWSRRLVGCRFCLVSRDCSGIALAIAASWWLPSAGVHVINFRCPQRKCIDHFNVPVFQLVDVEVKI